ncbi:SDR family NAD(P)-dependent oxidoreductase [Archangium violaceum]|uniref:SDR family NAD(P)-dependent oxidoreductase n=1 Tax=Archangium violaceum TaxID=83451 RepID=UPI0007C733A0|nr:SDR family NAD(P)-dependent oxidoreductase [Archangium violaceum]
MNDFNAKVAVITGAASGIGRGLAERCLHEGMRVVLADIEEPALRQTESELRKAGGMVLAVQTDVSKAADVEALARRTLDTFGAVHLLVNNAGVAAGGTIWESTPEDWAWVMDVNLMGVIHGLRAFVPLMLAQGTEGHVVNTASIAGVMPYHPSAPYQTTKAAVVALTENLHYSLVMSNARVRASVLCPGFVNTRILDSERNRPGGPRQHEVDPSSREAEVMAYVRHALQTGLSPARVADLVFDAIRQERLFIFTHPEYMGLTRQRLEAMLSGEALSGGLFVEEHPTRPDSPVEAPH